MFPSPRPRTTHTHTSLHMLVMHASIFLLFFVILFRFAGSAICLRHSRIVWWDWHKWRWRLRVGRVHRLLCKSGIRCNQTQNCWNSNPKGMLSYIVRWFCLFPLKKMLGIKIPLPYHKFGFFVRPWYHRACCLRSTVSTIWWIVGCLKARASSRCFISSSSRC